MSLVKVKKISKNRETEKILLLSCWKKEKTQLEALISWGKHFEDKVMSPLILLNFDTLIRGVKRPIGKTLGQILQICNRKSDRVKYYFFEGGLKAVLNRKPSKQIYEYIVDRDAEAYLIVLSCSEPPEARRLLTLQLLVDRAVKTQYVKRSYMKQ
ncbi:MAG: hypothetical protein ACTXOO_04500 [Sodalis sp. (in: enterobacteria)]